MEYLVTGAKLIDPETKKLPVLVFSNWAANIRDIL
jgi:hypothetical protein